MLCWLRNKWQRDLVTLREKREQEKRERKILCPRCGYDIKGMPDLPCSECGLFIESRWHTGWFGAGSPMRWPLPWILGYLGAKSLLMMALLFGAAFMMGDTFLTGLEYYPKFWVPFAAAVTHGLVALGVVAFAIVRRRWLVYGPRAYAIRTTIFAAVLLIGTSLVVQKLFAVMSD